MAFKLTEKDNREVDAMLDSILKMVADAEVTVPEARGAIAHVLTAAALDNDGVFKSWLKPETLASWKEMTDADRT